MIRIVQRNTDIGLFVSYHWQYHWRECLVFPTRQHELLLGSLGGNRWNLVNVAVLHSKMLTDPLLCKSFERSCSYWYEYMAKTWERKSPQHSGSDIFLHSLPQCPFGLGGRCRCLNNVWTFNICLISPLWSVRDLCCKHHSPWKSVALKMLSAALTYWHKEKYLEGNLTCTSCLFWQRSVEVSEK